jgi:SAM-dependent methyltransferase
MVNYVKTSTKIKKLQKSILNKINYRLLKKYLGDDQLCILDYGCGAGDTLATLSKLDGKLKLTGCDINQDYLDYTRSRINSSIDLISIRQLKQNFEFNRHVYDVIICLQVIEHINDPEDFYSLCEHLLKPGGILFVTTPNLSGLAPKLIGNRWHGFHEEEHVNLYTKSRLENEISENNYEILFSGTSFLSGLPIIRKSPLRLMNDFSYYILNYQKWGIGDSIAVIAKKRTARETE